MKRPWRDGTTSLLFTPQELLEKLCTLVPRPRTHLTRYFGVLAPAFSGRSQIVPAGVTGVPPTKPPQPTPPEGAEAPKGPGRFSWASLIWRVFLNDVLSCARCSGRMRIVAAVTAPAAVAHVLEHLGLSGEVPTFHPARPPPQAELRWDDDSADCNADPPAPDEFAA